MFRSPTVIPGDGDQSQAQDEVLEKSGSLREEGGVQTPRPTHGSRHESGGQREVLRSPARNAGPKAGSRPDPDASRGYSLISTSSTPCPLVPHGRATDLIIVNFLITSWVNTGFEVNKIQFQITAVTISTATFMQMGRMAPAHTGDACPTSAGL